MEASTSTAAAGTAKPTKHARLAEDPPSLPVGAPANLNDHHHDDQGESDDDGAESDFDESTVKTEGGLISKMQENLDERTFEDKKKVALRELNDDGTEKKDEDDEDEVDEATSNAGKQARCKNKPDISRGRTLTPSYGGTELLAEFPDDTDVCYRVLSRLPSILTDMYSLTASTGTRIDTQ